MAMLRLELPLIGLLEDTILPGEERSLAAPVVDATTLTALRDQVHDGSRPPAHLCALAIASIVELPSLVSARWGTECTLLAADGTSVTLRGERRVRLLSARGRQSPYTAEVEVAADSADKGGIEDIVAGMHAIVAALDTGSRPDLADMDQRLHSAAGGLVRALSSADQLKDLMRQPLAETLQQLAKGLAAQKQGQHASCALEASMRQIAEKPNLPKALKHRLWAQVVEIQKRLDIHDPSSAEEGDDVTRVQRRLMQAGLPKVARETAKREIRLVRNMPSSHHDYSAYIGHLDFMARLSWHPDPPKPVDLEAVEKALEQEHFGLQKAKQRVLEYLAVRALGGESSSMILCLVGPPGAGKTSIARAIARALGRPFVSVPLGGVHDESEIRGHRMSFLAASAGRILNGLAQVGSASALMLLDEIDKIGTDRQRSPAAALLEVLDPEQNTHFQDNYLAVPYDLSHVLFIATANDSSLIHPTLLDRMEPVELEGYTVHEKAEIATRHLMERLRAEHGLPVAPAIEKDALLMVIEGHTREAGVRQLRRTLGAIFRARALNLVRSKAISLTPADEATDPTPPPITATEVQTVLGPKRYAVKTLPDVLPVGVATGLSVGADGGSILFIEVGLMQGSGKLTLTGRLGDVMQETAHAALAHLRMDPARYGVDPVQLGRDIHLHVPEAATAKDGPSAGVAVFVALLSAARGFPLRTDVALTGEISLTGRVLAVGGVRAKLLAAERAGVQRVILPEGNHADIPADLSLEVVLVGNVEQAVRAAFSSGFWDKG